MDEKEQLKLMLKKYLEVRLDSNTDEDGDIKIGVTIFFDGEEIDYAQSWAFIKKN